MDENALFPVRNLYYSGSGPHSFGVNVRALSLALFCSPLAPSRLSRPFLHCGPNPWAYTRPGSNIGNYTQVVTDTAPSKTQASANQATIHQLNLFHYRALIATKNYARAAQEITQSHALGLQALKAQAVYLDAVQSADAAGRDAALAHLRDMLQVQAPDDPQPETTALEVKVVVGQVLASEGLVEEALTVLLPHNNHLER